MKFKSVFILFNITLLLFLAIIIALPLFMLGPSFSGSLWQDNWPLILILVLLFAGFNTFYFINRRLFLLLEKEDWPALVRYLEEKVIQKGKYTPRLVRLLANCYLVLSDSAAVMNLENKTAIVKPALVDANVLVFGTARILGRDISGAARFFKTRKDSAKSGLKEWVSWYYGFALLLDRQFEEAYGEFSLLARAALDGIVSGLSSYFLSDSLAKSLPEKAAELREISSLGKERVLKVLPLQKNWQKESSRLATEIHAAAISKYMEAASRWLYGGKGYENI